MSAAAPAAPGLLLRAGLPADAPALARLHVEVWRQTYADLAPPEALARLDEARRLPVWEATLASADSSTGALVAVRGEVPVGVVAFAPSTHPAMGGAAEIKHLYVRRVARGSGLGARLLAAAFARLREAGHAAAALSVVEENAPARAFYRAQGGEEAGRFTDPGPLWRSSNIVMRWRLAP
ncbi:GNAT family N-acetyltransferase [Albimonas sp. CAU 1670]|uniref:GNAT family N-acetyltransferase n=1 Tax=Albimonas sp. CAU 1670 TaxID=3032599 RepID=UPI0023DC544D|nr:GNAT family N-acetyltransferase [Albimonas sp. CAU 1670]MDF2231809.1 GNAT family N-acetyltransferase [Albimonas sp. CAU 1670]